MGVSVSFHAVSIYLPLAFHDIGALKQSVHCG